MRMITREQYEERLLRVQMHIQKNLDSALTLEELSGIACFSPYHFHRIFRGMVGESLMGYIRRLRMEKAAWRLVVTDQDILTTAIEAGYDTPEAFTKSFCRRFGMPPTEYRKHRRSQPAEYASSPVETFTILFAKQEGKTMKVDVRECEPIRVAFVRHTGPYDQCQAAWEKLCSSPDLVRQMEQGATVLGISYDDPDTTEPEKIRYDACIEIPSDYEPTNGISHQTVEGGKYAITIHQGPYQKLIETYKYLYGQWLPDSGYQAGHNPCVEVYLNCPQTTPPDDLRTEVRIPIQ